MRLERRAALSQDEFIERYLRAGRPVLVEDAIARWSESGHTLSERFFLETFASSEVQVYDDLFDLMAVCPLEEYIEQHWHTPSHSAVPYVRWYARFHEAEFAWADEAFARIAPCWSMPYFLPRSGYELPRCHPPDSIDPARDAFPARGIFISAAGARTRLHTDPWCSEAVLCQLTGRKRVLMYSPADGEAPGEGGPAAPEGRHPDIEDVLEPGETLFIPAGWHHHVDTMTRSISLTWNFVHAAHAERFRRYRAGDLSSFDRAVLEYFGAL